MRVRVRYRVWEVSANVVQCSKILKNNNSFFMRNACLVYFWCIYFCFSDLIFLVPVILSFCRSIIVFVFLWSLTEDLITSEAATEQRCRFNSVRTRVTVSASSWQQHFRSSTLLSFSRQYFFGASLTPALMLSNGASELILIVDGRFKPPHLSRPAESSTLIGQIRSFHQSQACFFVQWFLHSNLLCPMQDW